MNAISIFDPPIKFDMAGKTPLLMFSAPNEIRDFVTQQHEFYQEMDNVSIGTLQQDPALHRGRQFIAELFNPVRTNLERLYALETTGPDRFREALAPLMDSYAAGRLLHFGSPGAFFVRKIAKSDPAHALRILVVLSDINLALGTSTYALQWFRAGAAAEIIRLDLTNDIPSEEASLESYRAEWDRRFFEMLNKHEQQSRDAASLQAELSQQKTASARALAEFEETRAETTLRLEADWVGTIAQAGDDIEAFKKTYNEAISLRAPTHYWRSKRNAHRFVAAAWFGAFLGAAAAGAYGVWFVWHWTVETRSADPTYTAFLPSLGAALLATWFLRLFSRQVISNLGLSADAGERVAMVQTYLALTEGGLAGESDRTLILSSLFRSAGKSEEDASPSTLADIITKALKEK
ncbi:MAG: hypothetical protein JWL84_6091 [Rhodospirillales bacterium]|nr:hypothetical protein [Rhodospirillales bacterium]